jgi:hypothetical protein
MFGTDYPFGVGGKSVTTIIDRVNRMGLSEADRESIFSGVADRLLR